MDLLEKIITAVVGTAIVGVVGLYIWQRRLCAVAKYFPYSEISSQGITLLVTLLNRGHKPEAEIKLELDPRRQYQLLSRTADGIRLEGSTLKLDRLPQHDDAGAIILVEGGDFTNSSIVSFASKDAKGRVFDGLEKVPQPPGVSALGLLATLIVIAGSVAFYENVIKGVLTSDILPYALPSTGDDEKRIAELESVGWRDVDVFVKTDFGKKYGLGEAPVTITLKSKKKSTANFDVTVWNKGADYITVSVSVGSMDQGFRNNLNHHTDDMLIPAGEKRQFIMASEIPEGNKALPMQAILNDDKGDLHILAGIYRFE